MSLKEDLQYVGRLLRKPGFFEGEVINVFEHEGHVLWVIKLLQTRVKYDEKIIVTSPMADLRGYFIQPHELGFH